MVQISSPSIIHIYTSISFPQLLILFLLWPHILMETLYHSYFLLHMIIFMLFQSHLILNSKLGRCYSSLKRRYMVHFTILQLYKELIVLDFLLFGKEYAQISFPFQILFSYKSMLAARSIYIMILHHQMMSYKEYILLLLADTTL